MEDEKKASLVDKLKDVGKSMLGDKEAVKRMAKRDEESMKKDFPGFYGKSRHWEHR